MEINVLQDVVIADQHPWISPWNLKQGETRNVPAHVADRLIARKQAKLTAEESAKQSETKPGRKGRPRLNKKDEKNKEPTGQ